MQSERTNDNSMITIRKSCRVIGVINCLLAVISIAVYLISIVGVTFGKFEFYGETKDGNISIKDVIVNFMILQICIICFLSYFNYRLSNRNTPRDGSVIKQWLLYHILSGAYVILYFIVIIIYNYKQKNFFVEMCIAPIVIIIIIGIELYIVNNFKNQITSGVENQPSSA